MRALLCCTISYKGRRSNRNPLDFIERDLIAGTVVELGGARAFVRSHQLGVFQRAAGLEIAVMPVARKYGSQF